MYLVLDFGGSAVKGAIIDASCYPSKLNIIEKFSLNSQASNLCQWFSLFDPVFSALSRRHMIEGIAISVCAAVDVESGEVFGSSLLRYILDQNVKQVFERRYQLPVEIENDACCAALCEQHLGDNQQTQDLCFVVIGSGIGGAVISDGQLIKGHNLYAGEFGYAILGFENGKPLIVSELASTRGLVKQVASALNVPKHQLDGLKVFDLYHAGQVTVVETVERWAGYLATALFNLQYTLDPEVIVLGGGISQQPALLPLINTHLEQYQSSLPFCHIMPNVTVSKFGNDANLFGAVIHYMQRKDRG
ncbi:N-acetylmannosamine kinase [Vibrio ponticus]|nr:N-acetylmannosamine kinase [Vibrio ponticus]